MYLNIDLVTFWVTIINLDLCIGKYRDYVMPAYHRRNLVHGSELPTSKVFSSWVFYILFLFWNAFMRLWGMFTEWKPGVRFQHLLQPEVNPATVNEHLWLVFCGIWTKSMSLIQYLQLYDFLKLWEINERCLHEQCLPLLCYEWVFCSVSGCMCKRVGKMFLKQNLTHICNEK